MNLHRLVKWADQLLKHSPKGGAAKGSLLAKLRARLHRLPDCKIFTSRFIRDATALLERQKMLKNNGLSLNSRKECQQLTADIPASSPVRRGFETWAEKQLMAAKSLGLKKTGIPISSDCIESLFGVSKQHGAGKIKDANRIALRIPALCGKLTKEDAKEVLNITVKEQREVENSLPSSTGQRRQVLPNPGCLDKIECDEAKQNLELIPKPGKQVKNPINSGLLSGCQEMTGPPGAISSQEKTLSRIAVMQ